MQRSLVIYDGLWRCLCTSIGRSIAQHAAWHPASVSLARWQPRRRLEQRTSNQTTPRRVYSTETSTSTSTSIDSYIRDMLDSSAENGKKRCKGPSYAEMLTRKIPPSAKELSKVSIEELIEGLHTLRGREKPWVSSSPVQRHARITLLVRHLLVARKQRLTAFFYECLMDAMGDPHGSGITVINLIRDMAQNGVEPTQALYNSALASLMVHPNYVAQLEILEFIRGRQWPVRRQTVAVALLRDEQYELAYDTLMALRVDKIRIEPWVYDIFVLVFGKMGFLDEMLDLLAARLDLRPTDDGGDDGLDTLQLFALDVCSAAFHYPGTVAGWNTLVRGGRVNPSDGIVENVLDTAAREADTALASEALDVLAQRTRTRDYHYDSLVEAFTRAGDLAGVVRVYCIMHDSDIPITQDVADRLVRITEGRDAELNSWLFEASQQGALVPPALVDAAMLRQVAASDSSLAMSLFSERERLCGDKCSHEMALRLLRRCKDVVALNELCDRFLDDAQGADDSASLLGRYRDVVMELFKDGRPKHGQVCFDKLTERGLDTSGIERPAWWTLIPP